MIIKFLFFIIFTLIVNHYIKLNNFLPSHTGDKHQSFVEKKNIQLTGGIFVLLIFLFFLNYDLILFTYLILIFLLGFISDKKIINSAKLRFFLQFILIVGFVYQIDLNIDSTKLDYLDNLLTNQFFSYFFSLLCLMVLLNGSNFIDGLNGLLLGYFTIVLIILNKIGLLDVLGLSESQSLCIILSLSFLLLLNFFNKLYLGDSGSYILSIFMGYVLISTYSLNDYISPYYVILLLWYPCFENLFSVLRKARFNKSPIKPDNKHLHQLLFAYLKKKYKISNLKSNVTSSLLINFYNLILILIATINYKHSFFQVSLIFISTIIYLKTYMVLIDLNYKPKK